RRSPPLGHSPAGGRDPPRAGARVTPLGHLRVLDLSRQLPGPFCSTLLADFGADVLMVARPDDPFATGIPFLARNKRSMTLNLKAETGREIFLRLAADADVVLEGFRPGIMARLGIGWERLSALNPRLVYCAISGYGQDGPYRDRTGRGQLVDVAMLDGAVAWNVYHTLLYLLSGRPPERGRTQLTGYFPCYAVYETRDGRHVTVGAYEEHFWATLCRHFGREDFIPTQWDEGPTRDEMFAFFRAAFRAKTLVVWVTELGDVDVCFAPVATLDETFADPQVRHRRMVVEHDGTLTLGTPIKLSETPASLRTAPAKFGEHTDGVLASLGFGAEEIARLRRDRVV